MICCCRHLSITSPLKYLLINISNVFTRKTHERDGPDRSRFILIAFACFGHENYPILTNLRSSGMEANLELLKNLALRITPNFCRMTIYYYRVLVFYSAERWIWPYFNLSILETFFSFSFQTTHSIIIKYRASIPRINIFPLDEQPNIVYLVYRNF